MRRIAVAVFLMTAARADTAEIRSWLEWLDRGAPGRAVPELRKIGPRAFPEVLKALPKFDVKVQRWAALLLQEYSEKLDSIERYGNRVITALRKSEDATVRERLAATLIKCGPKNLPALISLAAHENYLLAESAVKAIARIGKPAWPRIHRILDSRSATYRRAGLEIVAEFEGEVAVFEPRVLELCSDKSTEVRAAAMLAIPRVMRNADAARKRLVAAMDDPKLSVAYSAGRGLARLNDAASVASVLARIEARNGVDCKREIAVLRLFGSDRASDIEKGLQSTSDDVCLAVARVFMPSTPATRKALLRLVASKQEPVRVQVAAMLGDSAEETQGLVTLAGDESAAVRDQAIWSLATRASKLTPLFVKASKDSSSDVRAGAWLGLWRAQAKELPPLATLQELFRDNACARSPTVIAEVWPSAPNLVNELVSATASPNEARATAATHALGVILPHIPKGTPRARGDRFAQEPARIREACERAWKWLESRQKAMPGGVHRAWSSAGNFGHPHCDVGVSALAVLAFTAAGWHADSTVHGAALRDAGAYLRSRQEADGHLGPKARMQSAVQHAIAANALCELALLGPPRPSELKFARKALAYTRAARNKHLGWRYRARGGENDTFVTTWMVLALKTGEHVGLGADEAAYEGARLWYDKMTDPEFGQAGYYVAGGSPARIVDAHSMTTGVSNSHRNTELSQSMTAMVGWTRVRLGLADPARDKLFKLGAKLMGDVPPRWAPEGGSIDLCYWMFGSRAMSMASPKDDVPWRKALVDALLPNQKADGSWPADGVWGKQGGTVYATSMAVMALLGRVPYGRDLEEPQSARLARTRLQALKQDKRRSVARAATEALKR